MYNYLIEILLGIISGMFLGITGINPVSLILITLDILKIGNYKSNLGAILFLNIFPITLGSVIEFHKAKNINYSLGFILIITVAFGSFIGSKLLVDNKRIFTDNIIKYITGFLSIFIGIIYILNTYMESNK